MISIIIPTLNEESVIDGTLRGLKSKLTLPHEIIISDGKSKDRTVEIARMQADKVIVHGKPERQNIAQGRNEGARAATGDFLVFLDADCSIPDPDAFFARALRDFDDPRVVAVAAWIRVLPEAATLADNIVFNTQNCMELVMNNLLRKGFAPGEFQMMRRSAFDALGGYNTGLTASEDLDMFSRLSKIGRTHFDRHLVIFHTGRRAHKTGWPHLLTLWFLNTVWITFSGKAYSSEWKPIR